MKVSSAYIALLTLIIASLWIDSEWNTRTFGSDQNGWRVYSDGGTLTYRRFHGLVSGEVVAAYGWYKYGLGIYRFDHESGWSRSVSFPYWAFCSMLVLVLALLLISAYRRRAATIQN